MSIASSTEPPPAVPALRLPAFPHSRPFLRWTGGKQKLVERLREHVPNTFRNYFEPFVGAGSLFFAISASTCNLSDANSDLIETYFAIKDRPDLVSRYLQEHSARHCEKQFYRTRAKEPSSRFAAAARFIYLNRAAYGGIYRVNQKGEFNVPYGPGRTGLNLPSASHINGVSAVLNSRVKSLETLDFEDACARADKRDFIYLDPPYVSAGPTEFFRHYTRDRFGPSDEKRFKLLIDELSHKGVFVLATVRQTELAVREFSAYDQSVIDSPQWMSSRARGRRLPTLLVKNY